MTRLSLFAGDSLNRALGLVGLGRERGHWAGRRAFAGWAVTWGGLAVLAAASGVLLGPSPRETFLIDFAAYGQFWIAVPLLLLAESGVDRHLQHASELFRQSGLVREGGGERFESALEAANRTKGWWGADAAILASTFLLSWIWLASELANGTGSWHARLVPGGERVTLAGWWLFFVGIPVYNYLLLRWIFKLGVWYVFLWKVSHLDLALKVGHPDRAGGLGFLGDLQAVFGMLIFGVGSAVAATVGYKITIEHTERLTVATAGPGLAFVVLAPCVFLAPLLFFSRQLYWAKVHGLGVYSVAAARHADAFERKWLNGRAGDDEEFLGSPDIGSHADMNATFESVRQMRIFPFDLGTVLRLALSAGAPMLPLLARLFPEITPWVGLVE